MWSWELDDRSDYTRAQSREMKHTVHVCLQNLNENWFVRWDWHWCIYAYRIKKDWFKYVKEDCFFFHPIVFVCTPLFSPFCYIPGGLEEPGMVVLLQALLSLCDQGTGTFQTLTTVCNLLSQLSQFHHLEHTGRVDVLRQQHWLVFNPGIWAWRKKPLHNQGASFIHVNENHFVCCCWLMMIISGG